MFVRLIDYYMIPQDQRRLTIPEDVYLRLEEIAAEERKGKAEIIASMITPLSLAQSILRYVTANRKIILWIKRIQER
jgi:hypothetical protein